MLYAWSGCAFERNRYDDVYGIKHFDASWNGESKRKRIHKNWVAVIGDSTFLHTGINSLMNMVYNHATGTVLILDNSTTGMTGHQDHAATGKTLQGDPTYAIDIPALCRAVGVKMFMRSMLLIFCCLKNDQRRGGKRRSIGHYYKNSVCTS